MTDEIDAGWWDGSYECAICGRGHINRGARLRCCTDRLQKRGRR